MSTVEIQVICMCYKNGGKIDYERKHFMLLLEKWSSGSISKFPQCYSQIKKEQARILTEE